MTQTLLLCRCIKTLGVVIRVNIPSFMNFSMKSEDSGLLIFNQVFSPG